MRKHWEKFQFQIEALWKEKEKNFPSPNQFHDQLTKVKLLLLKLRHFCILHGGKVTLFYEMPITRVQSNAIGVAQLVLCARYVNMGSEVKLHVHSGTSERKNKAPLSKPVEANKIGLRSVQPAMIKLKTFSHYLFKNNGRNRIGTTRSASASSQFKMNRVALSDRFSVPLTNPDNN